MKNGILSLLTLIGLVGVGCSEPTAPVAIASIQVTAPNTTLASGATVQLHATTVGTNGKALTDRIITWTSSDPALATVTNTGVVTAGVNRNTIPHTVVITAALDDHSAAATIAIAPDTNHIINQRLADIRSLLNDAFRLKFITNRVRAEYAVVNPQAWTGSFIISPQSNADSLVFPSYYHIPTETIISPIAKVTFGDHHTRWEYRVKVPRDTVVRAEYIWIERDLNKHPIDTFVYRIFQTQPYTWELESGNYIDSNIKVPTHVLSTLSPRWHSLTKLKGYDHIERFLSGPQSQYTYATFNTCYYQNVEDSLAYYYDASTPADMLHRLKGYWLIEYPTYRRQVAFKFDHVVTTTTAIVTRRDSTVIVNTNPQTFVGAYNFGAMDGEAGISTYTWSDSSRAITYRLIVDRGEWHGSAATTERVTLIDLVSRQTLTSTRPIH
jgi:Bacterial Ig-like domain (group 2)